MGLSKNEIDIINDFYKQEEIDTTLFNCDGIISMGDNNPIYKDLKDNFDIYSKLEIDKSNIKDYLNTYITPNMEKGEEDRTLIDELITIKNNNFDEGDRNFEDFLKIYIKTTLLKSHIKSEYNEINLLNTEIKKEKDEKAKVTRLLSFIKNEDNDYTKNFKELIFA